MRVHATIALLGAFLVATPLSAQICTGTASFAAGRARAGAGASFAQGATGYYASIATGLRAGPFGSLDLSRIEREAASSTTQLGVSGGYAIDSKTRKNVQFCPVLQYAHLFVPDLNLVGGGPVERSGDMLGFGASVGGSTPLTPTTDFIPFGNAAFVTSRAKATLRGVTTTGTSHYLALGVGAGFVLDRTWTIVPAVSVPLGLQGGQATWTIAFAINFGAPTRPK